ncbi:hypothetical protein EON67_04015 [archaeon]|nr:MAG: hypothetical protein EON67_04015 [archaeon]
MCLSHCAHVRAAALSTTLLSIFEMRCDDVRLSAQAAAMSGAPPPIVPVTVHTRPSAAHC